MRLFHGAGQQQLLPQRENRRADRGASLSFDIYGENVEMELETWVKDARPNG